ncbi:CRISPR-associated helicase Cas3' [Lyngbya confervoides]|uniref:CRISPR-associated helicase Cas3 n=1 Tax=Lyngbya confervoides BDU141951 TaxID=1574623 RepID=A0ABD4T5X7_9CYAN|nr:CRISPR-associated helicase Cas3' [Lyngbya confervoides]MCM1983962.1 CRISPR-associated helicase Cas3' [Lyngbya confervoides BDU141951]
MSELPKQLWAKSKSKLSGKQLSLEQHLLDAEQAAHLIFRLEGRWGRNWCRFFKIKNESERQKFLLNLRVAALFHDIGKANADFYEAVTTPGFKAQTLRHEHLSALVLCLPSVRKWLSQNPDLDVDVITAAVLSHHLKASESQVSVRGNQEASERFKYYRWCQPQTAKTAVDLYFQHVEVIKILDRISKIAELEGGPELPTTDWKAGSVWDQAYKQGKDAGRRFNRVIKADDARRMFLVAVKAGLIVADSAASGLVRVNEGKIPIADWINDVVHAAPIADSDIETAILKPRAQQIAQRLGTPFQPRSFQTKMAQQSSRALLLAACGAGKTLGAWMWAEAQSRKYEIGKVIFLYPTRGTATEGFRDYVGWAPETDAALMTGTARYELEAMQENPSDAIKGKDFQADERLYSLGFWSRRYFSATVDQFLSFMEHSYSSLCLLPVLADSAVIIDEIHSFDRKMFDTLISFLKHFHIPVLCMTATLPTSRRQELIEAGLQVFPKESDRPTLEDLKDKEEHPRYDLEPVDNFNAAFQKAIHAYQAGERVLWVVNTVDRCLAIAEKLENHKELKKLQAKVLTYHSRFRLCDRQQVHAKTVAAFAYQQNAAERKPVIAVTTQVCEMSLDLDADVLITEIAPVPSLVQRFGRANRHLARGREFRAKIHTYSPPAKRIKPYTKEDLEVSTRFLEELSHKPISQYALAEALERHSQQERSADGSARFLNSGYYATPGSFRDTDEYSIPCILDTDLEAVKSILDSPEKHKKEQFIINVPRKWAHRETEHYTWLPKYLGVAESVGHYDNPERGFITKPLEEVELG